LSSISTKALSGLSCMLWLLYDINNRD
jgi:hypothetical protein